MDDRKFARVSSPRHETIAIRAVRPQFLVFRRGRAIGVEIEVTEATYIADVEESAQARTAGNRFHLVALRRLIGFAEERHFVAVVGLPHRIPIEAARRAELAWYPDRKSTRLNSSHLRISYA